MPIVMVYWKEPWRKPDERIPPIDKRWSKAYNIGNERIDCRAYTD